jgi:MYXO-CTERM domain-containing protein
LRAGEPVEGATATAQLPAVLVPGQVEKLEFTLQPPTALYARGETIGLRVRALVPGLPAETLSLLTGGPDPSRVDFRAIRIPRALDLLPAPPGAVVFSANEEVFRPSDPNARVLTLTVGHDAATFENATVAAGQKAYLVLLGVESQDIAERHHEDPRPETRQAAAHVYQVGTTLVFTHPGLGVALPLDTTRAGVIDVQCFANCPARGFLRAVVVEGASAETPTPRSALIPPPRNELPIEPTPSGEPARETPGAGGALVLIAVCAGAMRRRR